MHQKKRAVQTTVCIHGLQVTAYVGLANVERRQSQTVLVDVMCELASPDITKDEMTCSVNYAPIAQRIREIAKENTRKLIETFADEIAEVCFEYALVSRVTVSVRKPYKLQGSEAVGVTRIFERE